MTVVCSEAGCRQQFTRWTSGNILQ